MDFYGLTLLTTTYTKMWVRLLICAYHYGMPTFDQNTFRYIHIRVAPTFTQLTTKIFKIRVIPRLSIP